MILRGLARHFLKLHGAVGRLESGANLQDADLTDAIEEIGVGKKVEITAVRDGRHRKVQAEITDVSRS